LGRHGRIECFFADEFSADQELAHRGGGVAVAGVEDLAVVEEENTRRITAAESQLARLPEQCEYLEDFGKPQILKTTDESHGSLRSRGPVAGGYSALANHDRPSVSDPWGLAVFALKPCLHSRPSPGEQPPPPRNTQDRYQI
jgi:hypothetical protein